MFATLPSRGAEDTERGLCGWLVTTEFFFLVIVTNSFYVSDRTRYKMDTSDSNSARGSRDLEESPHENNTSYDTTPASNPDSVNNKTGEYMVKFERSLNHILNRLDDLEEISKHKSSRRRRHPSRGRSRARRSPSRHRRHRSRPRSRDSHSSSSNSSRSRSRSRYRSRRNSSRSSEARSNRQRRTNSSRSRRDSQSPSEYNHKRTRSDSDDSSSDTDRSR